LIISADESGVASVLRFQDKPNETTIDEGQARGSLADAIMTMMEELKKKQKKKKVKK